MYKTKKNFGVVLHTTVCNKSTQCAAAIPITSSNTAPKNAHCLRTFKTARSKICTKLVHRSPSSSQALRTLWKAIPSTRQTHTRARTQDPSKSLLSAALLVFPAHLGLSSLEANLANCPSTLLLALFGRFSVLTLDAILLGVSAVVGGIAYTMSLAVFVFATSQQHALGSAS